MIMEKRGLLRREIAASARGPFAEVQRVTRVLDNIKNDCLKYVLQSIIDAVQQCSRSHLPRVKIRHSVRQTFCRVVFITTGLWMPR